MCPRVVRVHGLSHRRIGFRAHAHAKTAVDRRTVTMPAGAARVHTDQPLGELAALLLEPWADEPLFQWGFFLDVLQRTEYAEAYALEPLACRMLVDDRELAAAFRARLESDAEFAGSPRARLRWF